MAKPIKKCRRCHFRGRVTVEMCPKCGYPLTKKYISSKKGRDSGFARR